MADSLDERIAAAHAAQRENAYVAQRIDEATADKDRLEGELAAARRAVQKEQTDVDNIGVMFRLLGRHRAELDRELDELATAKLQLDGIAEELRATEYDLKQLRERARACADADLQYEIAIAEKETRIRLDPGPAGAPGGMSVLSEKLSAIAETERSTRSARRQIAEAINAGQTAHDALVGALAGLAATHGLSAIATQLGATQRALVCFQRECKDVVGEPLAVPVTPIKPVVVLCGLDCTWTHVTLEADLAAELGKVTSLVEDAMSALRERDAQLDRGLDRLVHQRAALLDTPSVLR